MSMSTRAIAAGLAEKQAACPPPPMQKSPLDTTAGKVAQAASNVAKGAPVAPASQGTIVVTAPPAPKTPLDDFVEETLLFEFDALNLLQSCPHQKMSQVLQGMRYKEGMVCKALTEDGKGTAYYFPLKYKVASAAQAPAKIFFCAYQVNQFLAVCTVVIEDVSKPLTWKYSLPQQFKRENFESSPAKKFTTTLVAGMDPLYTVNLASSFVRKRSLSSLGGMISLLNSKDPQKKQDLVPVLATMAKSADAGPSLTIDKFMLDHFIIPFTSTPYAQTVHSLQELLKAKETIASWRMTKSSPNGSNCCYIVPLSGKPVELPGHQRAFLIIEDMGNQLFNPKILHYDFQIKKGRSIHFEGIDVKKSYKESHSFQSLMKLFHNEDVRYRPQIYPKGRKASAGHFDFTSIKLEIDTLNASSLGAAPAGQQVPTTVDPALSEAPTRFVKGISSTLEYLNYGEPAHVLLMKEKLPIATGVKCSDGTFLFPSAPKGRRLEARHREFLRINATVPGICTVAMIHVDYSTNAAATLVEILGIFETEKDLDQQFNMERVRKLFSKQDATYQLLI
jgi:hypothetical protein